MARRLDVSMSPAQLTAFLARPLTAVLCTNGPGGIPHAAAMWYSPVGDEVRMATFRSSQKAVDLQRDPRCAFHVDDGHEYDALCGALVRGEARLIDEPDEVFEIMRDIHHRYRLPRSGQQFDAATAHRYRSQAIKRIGIAVRLDDVASWDHGRIVRSEMTG